MASTYLEKTLGTATNSKIWTFSTWLKRSGLNTSQHIFSIDNGSARDAFSFDSDNGLRFYLNDSAAGNADLSTVRLLRDTNAFYHLVLTVDTTQATQENRIKLYINGTQYTWDETVIWTNTLNANTFNASGNTFRIGRDRTASNYFNGVMTHIHFTDGTAYDASTFGETDANGVWTPKTSPSVTYGTNGFFLKMENSGSMGTDSSGNANNFTVNGTLTQTIDTPSNVYATMNPLDHIKGTFTNGNLALECVTDAGDASTRGTLGVTKGKWYWEAKYTAFTGSGATATFIGIQDTSTAIATSGATNGYWYNAELGKISHNSTDIVTGLTTFSAGNIVGIGYDADNGNLYLWNNGVAENSGNPVVTGIDTSTTWSPFFGIHYGASNTSQIFPNFGNGYFGTTAVSSAGSNGNGSIFEYDVPTGYYALNTKNLATYG
jgi:hypothetical protein